MRIVFAGTPDFAAAALDAVERAGHQVVGVLTQPDRPAGRGLKLQASPVKRRAEQAGWPVWQPVSLRLDGKHPAEAAAARWRLEEARPEVIIVAAYGLLLPRWLLELPAHGCLNIHASLLPRWRGAAPIQRAIEAGDAVTGITIMQMDEGLDTGDICLTAPEPIAADDTAATLHDRLAATGGRLIVQALADLSGGRLPRAPQPPDGVTYARKIDKAESEIDWRQSAWTLERRIRAFDPFPGMAFAWRGERVKLWRARAWAADSAATPPAAPGTLWDLGPQRLAWACGEGVLEAVEVQRPGGRRTDVARALHSSPRPPDR